ncbi:PrsW family glutamic-type intramembrane protease [Novosphingobium sp.]|uniref:PrsW family glutamic-type intramembrane protease n=1 Tax=Novosphingobium sp. TaxID=1874826 RepID=UPI0025D68C0E|nr:PrsW family glutamic-type intramembrane protease [Novosphingobium sp.]
MQISAGQQELKRPVVAVVALLFVGVATCGPAYWEFFVREPGLVAAGAIAAFLVYLPSLWLARWLDHRPITWSAYAYAALFVMATSPVVSHVTWLLMQQGILYWKIVGFIEETAKLLPVVLLALLAPNIIRNRRDGLVIGAIAGFGFAIVEYAVTFALDNFPERGWSDLAVTLPARWALGTDTHIIWTATTGAMIGYLREVPLSARRIVLAIGVILLVMLTHGAQDFMGKLIAPLAIGALGQVLLSIGIKEAALGENALIVPSMLVFGTVVNTVLINVLVLPVLWWLVRSGPGRETPAAPNSRD